jgi:hypothetical protein
MQPIKPLPTDPDPLPTGPNKTILPSNTPYMVAGFGRRCVAGFGAPNDIQASVGELLVDRPRRNILRRGQTGAGV